MQKIIKFLKRPCLIPLAILCAFQTATAQQKILDSLAHAISIEKSDTMRIKMTNWRIDILGNTNLDSAIYYGLKNIAAAHKINFYEGEIIARQKLATNYFFKGDFKTARQQLESNRNFIKLSKDSSEFSILYANYGMMYGMQSIYDTSIQYYEKSIAIAERNDLENLGSNYSNIAIGYQQLGNFPMALHFQQKGLKLAMAQNDEYTQAYILVNMASTYNMMGETDNAEKKYLQALELSIKNKQKNIEIYSYSNLATLYTSERNWEKAYEAALNSLSAAGPFAEQGIRSAGYSKAAWALAYMGKYDEAAELARKAVSLADSSKQPLNITIANNAMGTNFFLQKKYNKAIPYFEKGMQNVKKLNLYSIAFAEVYRQLAFSYEQTGNYVKALDNFKLSAKIQDSLTREDNIRKTTELTMNYEFQKKQEAANAERRKAEELARTKQYALLGGLCFVLLLGIMAYIAYRNKQRANKILSDQKQKIESTLAELKSTQAQLIQSEKMASLGELTAGIAHEIQNPLNFVNNFSEINQELLREMHSEMDQGNIAEAKEMANDVMANEEKINLHGKRADSIVKGMLLHSRTSTGHKEPTDINALCDEYLRLSYHGIRAKDKSFNASMKTDFDGALGKIDLIPQDIGRVLLNLFNNAFYAVNEKQKKSGDEYLPTITVATRKTGNNIEIKVTDNGTGIPQKVVNKIFQPFFTTKPTGQGTGLGLSLSYDIIKAHGGVLKVETRAPEAGAEREGTGFIIQLPA